MMISFDNYEDFVAYTHKLFDKPEQKNVTLKMKKEGYPMPKLGKLIQKTSPQKDWKRLERFMKINGNKIKKSFPDGEVVAPGLMCHFVNGCIIEKKDSGYIFTTYTQDHGKCVVNHQSIHTNTKYGMISGFVNYFTMLDHFRWYGDGEDYVNEALNELLKKAGDEGEKFWDLTE